MFEVNRNYDKDLALAIKLSTEEAQQYLTPAPPPAVQLEQHSASSQQQRDEACDLEVPGDMHHASSNKRTTYLISPSPPLLS